MKAVMITTGGLSGGISSTIAGGNFWDGFRQGIITSGLNHVAHIIGGPGDPTQESGVDTIEPNGNPIKKMFGYGSPPTAGQWADPNYNIPGWKIVSSPQAGDVVAYGTSHYSDATGHTGIMISLNFLSAQVLQELLGLPILVQIHHICLRMPTMFIEDM